MKIAFSITILALLAMGVSSETVRGGKSSTTPLHEDTAAAAAGSSMSEVLSEEASDFVDRRKKKKKRESDDDSSDQGVTGQSTGTLMLNNVLDEYLDINEDLPILEDALVKAYNEAFSDGPFKVTGVRYTAVYLSSDSHLNDGSRHLLEDDAKTNLGQLSIPDWYWMPFDFSIYRNRYVYVIDWSCYYCGGRRKLSSQQAALADASMSTLAEQFSASTLGSSQHRDFENIFSYALKKSGLKEFKSLDDSSILFYPPSGGGYYPPGLASVGPPAADEEQEEFDAQEA